jgi:hypothetical protein
LGRTHGDGNAQGCHCDGGRTPARGAARLAFPFENGKLARGQSESDPPPGRGRAALRDRRSRRRSASRRHEVAAFVVRFHRFGVRSEGCGHRRTLPVATRAAVVFCVDEKPCVQALERAIRNYATRC